MQNPSASWNDGIPAFRTRQRRSTDETSVSGVSEVIFRASRKPRSTPEVVEAIRSQRSRIVKRHLYSKMTNPNAHSNMNDKKNIRPRGRPQVSGLRKLSKSVTVKFSKIDYERLLHRSRQANRSLAEFLRESAFNAQIVARHSIEETTVIRNLVGMANNLNQLARLSHQTGFYRTRNAVMELLEKLKVIMNEYKKVERRNT